MDAEFALSIEYLAGPPKFAADMIIPKIDCAESVLNWEA